MWWHVTNVLVVYSTSLHLFLSPIVLSTEHVAISAQPAASSSNCSSWLVGKNLAIFCSTLLITIRTSLVMNLSILVVQFALSFFEAGLLVHQQMAACCFFPDQKPTSTSQPMEKIPWGLIKSAIKQVWQWEHWENIPTFYLGFKRATIALRWC